MSYVHTSFSGVNRVRRGERTGVSILHKKWSVMVIKKATSINKPEHKHLSGAVSPALSTVTVY